MTVRFNNLVLPLAQKATAMRITDTAESHQARSGAITSLIGASLRQGDVDSKNLQSGLGIRISTMETRTTTTRITSSAPVLSADYYATPTFGMLVQAYLDCRKHKRNTASAMAFEQNLERNLTALYRQLINGTYAPGQSICFVITKPKPREVWAAEFKDRIVHHLFYNYVSPRFYASFIADSCACIPERGTLYAAKRLESKIRSATQNWSQPCFYLKCDLANFFVAIDKRILQTQLSTKISEPWWMNLCNTILFHDPRLNYQLKSDPSKLNRVPAHKRLINHAPHLGLPIGNLSSQFFANVYLNALDQFIKHQIGAKQVRHTLRQWLINKIKVVDEFIQPNGFPSTTTLGRRHLIAVPLQRIAQGFHL